MANRLTQIATRTGDDGTTGLGDGTRVPKDHLRVQAMGDVDELNSTLGVLLAEPLPDDVRELLVVIQHELFNLGGELSIPGYELLKGEAVIRLDEALAHYNAALPRLKEFILPAPEAQRLRMWAERSHGAPSARWSRSRRRTRCAPSRATT
jgi:cob(I)alamin adenosyltransferase